MLKPYQSPFLVDHLPESIVSAMLERARALGTIASGTGAASESLIDTSRRWKTSKLVVGFLGGDEPLLTDIEAVLKEIEGACNVRFDVREEVTGAFRRWSRSDGAYRAHIRVSFDLDGYFSLIGTDSVNRKLVGPQDIVGGHPHQTSLNLGGFEAGRPADWRGTTLHEFLHALGVLHEHSNFQGPCRDQFRWEDDSGYEPTKGSFGEFVPDSQGRRPGIYTYLSGPPNKWSPSKVDFNLRPATGPGVVGLGFDRRSVMLYRFDPIFYESAVNDCAPEGEALELSDGDREGLQRLYPPPLPVGEAPVAGALVAPASEPAEPAGDRALREAARRIAADPALAEIVTGGYGRNELDWGPIFPTAAPARVTKALVAPEGLFGFGKPKPWQHSEHQVGYIALADSVQLPIRSGAGLEADVNLRDSRVDLRLDRLRVTSYPGGEQRHEVLVSFRARNFVGGADEVVAFSQSFEVPEGQGAGIRGYPIFMGLSVGNSGLALQFATVNVRNSGDTALLKGLRSEAVAGGLGLLTSAQPAIKPLADLALGLGEALLTRHENVKVQDLHLGLDFQPHGTGVGLRLGSYVAVQVPAEGTINWADYVFDREKETIVHRETGAFLPYNYLLFRLTEHLEP